MNFFKYHANGNDFVITENTGVDVEMVCDRHFGIGADGVIIVEIIDNGCVCKYYNADGSYANFCGNGLCCVADWLMKQQSSNSCEIQMGDTVYVAYCEGEEIVCRVHCPELLGHNLYRLGVLHKVADEELQTDEYNLNFAEILNRDTLRIQTFEKGVGWTLSCGSGSMVSFYHYFIHDLVNRKVMCITEGGISHVWIEGVYVYYAVHVEEVFVGIMN